jgi:hypothetical protein
MMKIIKHLSDLSLPVFLRDGVGTFSHFEWIGCQGFIGPFPQPFLISDVKNCCKNTSQNTNANFFCAE